MLQACVGGGPGRLRGQPVTGGVHRRDHDDQSGHDKPCGSEPGLGLGLVFGESGRREPHDPSERQGRHLQ
jgi:hypothetical protein